MHNNRVIARQFLLIFLATGAGCYVLLQLDLLGRMSYAVEKGRLRAIREALPVIAKEADHSAGSRLVARSTIPAVVYLRTRYKIHGTLDEGRLEDLAPDLREWLRDHTQRDRGDDPQDTDDEAVREGLGSGFIVDAEQGHIVTSYHVVRDADEISVFLSNGRRYQARVLGTDAESDLAVLKINAHGLHELPLGDSDEVEVGDEVFAVGNPFGFDGTISRGIISGKGRMVSIPDVEYQGFLQTDAAINPGNSGGPLVNARGEVIGVNTAIASETGHYDGVGFAIPSGRVRRLIPQLIADGKVTRGFLGVHPVSVIETYEHAERLGWTESHGVVIDDVIENSPAQEAGVRSDDIIVSVDGEPVVDTATLMDLIAVRRPGTVVSLNLWRDQQFVALEVELDTRPSSFPG